MSKKKPSETRSFNLTMRKKLIGDAIFLINKATHLLQQAEQHYDCSQDSDFDEKKTIADAHKMIDFAYEYLESLEYEIIP